MEPLQKHQKTVEKRIKTKICTELRRLRSKKIAQIVKVHPKTRVKIASTSSIFFDKTTGKRKFWVFKWCTCRTTSQSHVNTLKNSWKPCKYHAWLRENTCKYRSGVSRPFGSHANTSQSHMKTRANTIHESLDLLEVMQIPRRAMWKYVQILLTSF